LHSPLTAIDWRHGRRRRPAELEGADAVTGARGIAILAGIAVAAIIQQGLGAPWYVAFVLGVVAYLLARYVGWAVTERRRFKRERDGLIDRSTDRTP
jgi:hypothetical protein